MDDNSLKSRTARSVKWNVIDRIGSQLLYAVTGVVLARELSQDDFGLVGALLIFQAFALLIVDSGFSYALIQRKRVTNDEYSSVFWFNMAVAAVIYAILWVCAPFIADLFQGDERLVPLSRVMFLSFILNASAIVQINRLAKKMDFKPIAITNCIALGVGGAVGIVLALTDFGAWAIVWQAIVTQAAKSLSLWIWCRWLPSMLMSWQLLKGFMRVGSGMFLTSLLNTIFQNLSTFFIGNRAGLVPLGYYSQAEKWSKMGITSVTQVLTASFLPALSEVQDDDERFRRVCGRMSRFTAYILFPTIIFLIVMATPIFHVLFGAKWDASIILFRLLLLRGIFTVLATLYNNFLLARGHSHTIFRLELLRDVLCGVAIALCIPYIALSTPQRPVEGLTILLIGQLAATAIAWIATLAATVRITGLTPWGCIRDLIPYVCSSAAIGVVIWLEAHIGLTDLLTLIVQALTALTLYLGINALFPSRIQRDVLSRFINHPPK